MFLAVFALLFANIICLFGLDDIYVTASLDVHMGLWYVYFWSLIGGYCMYFSHGNICMVYSEYVRSCNFTLIIAFVPSASHEAIPIGHRWICLIKVTFDRVVIWNITVQFISHIRHIHKL